MGLCESQENLKAQEFLTFDFEPLHPTSPNPSPIRNAGRRRGGNSRKEKNWRRLASHARGPKSRLASRAGVPSLGERPGPRVRGPGEEVLPISFPFFHEPATTRHPAKMAAATTPRSPPEPGARGRGPCGVSRPQSTTRAILKSRGAAVLLQPDSPCLGVPHAFTYSGVRPGADSLGSAADTVAGASPRRRCWLSSPPPKAWERPASSRSAPVRRRSSSSHYLPHCYLAVTGNDCPQQEVMVSRPGFSGPVPDC